MFETIIFVIFIAALAYFAAFLFFNGIRRTGEPPLIRGVLPFLGEAVSFGKDPLSFLRAARSKFGDVVTVIVAGTRMTFVMDPHSVTSLLQSRRDFEFHIIVNQLRVQTFGYSPEFPQLTNWHQEERIYRKTLLSPATIDTMTAEFQRRLDKHLTHNCDDLFTFVKPLFFAAQDVIYGEGFATEEIYQLGRVCYYSHNRNIDTLVQKFDRDFPLSVAGIPSMLLKNFIKARSELASTSFHRRISD